jgi:hypothetical protein
VEAVSVVANLQIGCYTMIWVHVVGLVVGLIGGICALWRAAVLFRSDTRQGFKWAWAVCSVLFFALASHDACVVFIIETSKSDSCLISNSFARLGDILRGVLAGVVLTLALLGEIRLPQRRAKTDNYQKTS